jgi:hypothetical protein
VAALWVGFRQAGVFVRFSGEAAPKYINIRRSLREIIFETCNENGWSLAYSELKINDRQQHKEPGAEQTLAANTA